jgi:hypothetical protein
MGFIEALLFILTDLFNHILSVIEHNLILIYFHWPTFLGSLFILYTTGKWACLLILIFHISLDVITNFKFIRYHYLLFPLGLNLFFDPVNGCMLILLYLINIYWLANWHFH